MTMKHFKKTLATLLAALQVAVPMLSWAQSRPTSTFSYDAVGQLTSASSPGGRTTQFQWDALGRQTGASRSGASVGYGFNGQNALTAVQDPRGLVTSYDRNGFGDARSQSSPDSGSSSYSYDANGNLTSRVNAAGQSESYSYDAADRVTRKTVSHPSFGSMTYSFSYGTSGAEAGNLVLVISPGVAISIAHNLFGQPTSVSQAIPGSPALTTGYTYAPNGALTAITYPSGRVVSFSIDGASRVSGISSGNSTIVNGVSYSAFGAVTGWTFGSGQSVSRTFDSNARNTSVTMPWGTRTYGYDVDDRIVSTADATLGSAAYAYDDQDRLTSATTSLGAWTYQYDGNGNRSGNSVNGSGYAVVGESSSNRVVAWSTPFVRSSSFTANGQTSQVTGGAPATACGSALALAYQADGQLAQSTVQTSAVNSPDGLRLQKTVAPCAGGAKTNFVYDPSGHLIGEYDAMGAVVRETVWLGNLPVAVYQPSFGPSAFYVYADNLGTPRAITSAGGQLVWKWDGEPFGATAANSNPSGLGVFAFNLRFPGQYFDAETGYHHNGWREYDPALGRYVQTDPIGLGGGLNTYVYANADPLSNADPSGLCAGRGCVLQGGIVLALRFAPQINAVGIAIAEAWGGVNVAASVEIRAATTAGKSAVQYATGGLCSIAEHGVAAEKGFPGIGVTSRGGPTFSNSAYLHPAGPGQQSVVKIELTGSRREDFKLANELGGFAGEVPKGRDTIPGCTWHHCDDFNGLSSTMELVQSDAHKATVPHTGSVSQYEKARGVEYKR